jgi:hypothetical protein
VAGCACARYRTVAEGRGGPRTGAMTRAAIGGGLDVARCLAARLATIVA